MENFIYSVNATIPVFLVMIIGYILKQIDMLDDHFAEKQTNLISRLHFPAYFFLILLKLI